MRENSVLDKLKNRKNISKLGSAVVLILLLTISLFAVLPIANAHTPPWQIPTYAYVVAAPNPVGVNQKVHVYMWLDAVYGSAGGTNPVVPSNGSTSSGALLSNSYRFHNYQLTITKPDGTTTQQTFAVVYDSTSNQYFTFTPDQVGTYTFNFTFPGQVYGANGDGYEGSPIFGDTYLPSHASATLTVQQTPIPSAINSYPLPTQYWTEPIYSENTDWWSISSNWLSVGNALAIELSPPVGGWNVNSNGYAEMYHPDAVGPLTSHIMWTTPLQFGGLTGGDQFYVGGSYPGDPVGLQYFEGSSYAPRFYNPIIIDGVLYYTVVASFTGSPLVGGSATGPTVAVDLRTGQQLWSKMNIPQLNFGYIYNVYDPDQHGVYPPILVSIVNGVWQLYDAYTGDALFNVTNVPSGMSVMGPSGEILKYSMVNTGTSTNPQWYLSQWNSSKLWQYDVNPYNGGGSLSPSIINGSNLLLIAFGVNGQIPIPITGELGTYPDGSIGNVPYGSTLEVNANIPMNATTLAQNGVYASPVTTYDWNISIPWADSMTSAPTIVGVNYGDIMLCRNTSLPAGFATRGTGQPNAPYTFFAVNLNASKGPVGSILWSRTYDPPAGNITLLQEPIDFQTRVFTFCYEETMQWVGFNLDTGAPLWGPTAPQGAWDYYGNPGVPYLPGVIAYGHLYDSSFGGVCYCYNDRTGALEWTYGNGAPGSDNSTYGGLNIFYGVYPTQIQSISNGVVYLATNEHTVPNPIYKGATYRAINATTGQQIWTLSGYPSEWATAGTEWATADGYLTCMNGYDNQIYSIGRGTSATTVSAPHVGVASGQPLEITGSVMDTSAGTTQAAQSKDFPNGVPCASDASMTAWMGYVYQQKPCPTDFTGVPVTLSVLDPNNNTYVIGSTTSDASGTYGFMWTPPVPGQYKIIATFAGTNGYWGSSATTYFAVSSTAASAASPAPVTTPSPVPASSGQPTTAPTPTSTAPASASPSPAPAPSQTSSSETYIVVVAAVIIIVVAAAAAVILRRKRIK